MTVLQRRRWTQQPPRPVPIDMQHPLARGLVGAWMPTPSGFVDLTPFGNHGFEPGTTRPRLIAGPGGGQAFGMPAAGVAWRAGLHTPSVAGAPGMSIALWARMPATPTAYNQFVTRDGGSAGAFDWGVFTDVSVRRLAFGFNGGYISTSQTTVPAGEWHFWHHSQNVGGTGTWYLNGAPAGTTVNLLALRPGNGRIRFNDRADGASGNSDIGRVYLWNRETSAAEARQMYQDEWSLLLPDTLAYRLPMPGVVISAVTATGITSTTATPRYTIDFP